MRTFAHTDKKYIRIARPPGNNSELAVLLREHIGEIYEIIEVHDCSGKIANSMTPCRNGGSPICPGRIRLGSPPFTNFCECYSYDASHTFDFLDN